MGLLFRTCRAGCPVDSVGCEAVASRGRLRARGHRFGGVVGPGDGGQVDGRQGVYTFDTGYRTTNSTAQWHIGSDWGGYATLDDWRALHGGIDLGYGGDGAVVVWEYPANAAGGRILCIGSGTYDWYAEGVDDSADQYHGNVAAMTLNAINYLNAE